MKKSIGKKIFLVLLFIYLFVPMLAIILFSVAGSWDTTILPTSYTFKYYSLILGNSQFKLALLRSTVISILTCLISIIIMVPSIYLASLHFKKLEKIFDVLSLLPFIMPGVVLVIGLIQIYSKDPINISGTMWILLGAYFIICLPFMYHSIRNSFRGINAPNLKEAAMILGCTEFQAFIKVIVPNIMRGLISAVLLCVAILFGDFALVNLLVGSSYQTVQMYLYNILSQNGHAASAVVTIYTIVIFVISYITTVLTMPGKKWRVKE
ncbi:MULTISPECIES: ABC transporter permease [Clostridium]|uniref:2-aminoethylphosphonate transport system permease protein PhnV n=2 Tax=Clostridium TaxID=1485 RepID=D8GMP8_CLOLD|nr:MULTISPECIES: ABC transporter permease [Clostridium]ADK15686.1 predicted ABC transporter, permease component [Clostridium ljungdahlii DSM 13528]AGY74937.1 ABC transporter permease [Clostridium autoethanogenum DSM 10061]ALU35111.1 ABC-type transporter integral membrane subunit [Clostridium autoethanogenum DSM 10061]OAA86572.1 putative 2-aminoethylphosphonate transport system permease protein PhnV [Clostridium ljungdahlii DSM 13528]OVY49389.1 putative 2-aminoethylphosphonate transport system 